MKGNLATGKRDELRGRTYRMIIVSEIRFLRESLAEIFGREPGVEVLGASGELRAALELCAAATPDIVLLDAAFRGGIGAVAQFHTASPVSRVVALALTETEESVIAWAEAGVAGYVPNTAALAELGAMLAGITQGAQTCSARVASGLLRRIARGVPRAPSGERETPNASALTARERQVAGMIGAGMSNKDIARELNIGLATTKSHVHNLLGKLNIQRRGQAAAWMRVHDRP